MGVEGNQFGFPVIATGRLPVKTAPDDVGFIAQSVTGVRAVYTGTGIWTITPDENLVGKDVSGEILVIATLGTGALGLDAVLPPKPSPIQPDNTFTLSTARVVGSPAFDVEYFDAPINFFIVKRPNQ